jgi:hypothetical protein
MKKLIYLIIIVLISSLVLGGCTLLSNISQVPATEQTKAKPAGNLAGAEKVPWNLSGAVMPVPIWGLSDIPGSDTASKLIVNQPNGNTEVTITGAMNGLNKNTTYKVILANGYTKFTGWNVVGEWSLRWVINGGGAYDHDMFITFQADGSFTGWAGYPAGADPYSIVEGVTGTIGVTTNGSVTIHITQGSYYSDSTGTIDYKDGKMSGTWTDKNGNVGTFSTLSGNATSIGGGSTEYPGGFNDYPTFTFMTDEYGSGSWHINLRDDDFPGPNTYPLSVWINNVSILISDSFEVVVD